MYCNDCGQALVAGQGYCPRCGRVSGMGMPATGYQAGAPGMFLPMVQVERRVNRLAVAWLVYAGLVGLSGLIGLAFAHAFLQGHAGDFGHWNGPGYGHRFWHGPEWPMLALRFARITLVVKFGLALAAGVGLMQKAHWGRIVAIVAGCLALFSFPLGTAIGIWTLVVLLNAPNAAAYEMMAQS